MLLPPVIYEDDTLMAFDKPSGMLVAPTRWEKQRTSLMALVQAKYGPHLANVHRLDTGTSGVVLCAKTKPALDFLSGQFQSKTVAKVYHALVAILPPERASKVTAAVRTPDGTLPESFAVELALGEDERLPGRMRVCKGRAGKPACSEFRVLGNFGRFAFLECRPLTGRTHQLRVHLAAAGAPILHDTLYGDPEVRLLLSDLKRGYKGREEEKPLIARLALHATELTIRHPVTREPLVVRSPLPREFEIALKYLRKYVPGRPRRGSLSTP